MKRYVLSPGRVARVLLLLGAVVLFASQFTRLDFLIDDAFISLSFSKNLATGHGLTFSHGARVEGYSNFLWVVLNALPLAVHPSLNPLASARVLGACFAALLAWAVYDLGARATRSAWVGALGVLLLATSTDLASAVLSGLETPAYASFVAAGFAFQLRARREPTLFRYAVAAMVAAALTRIDGFLPLGYLLAWEAGERIARGRALALRAYVVPAAVGVAVYLLWFVWRWHYYGLFLPSTYYAKNRIAELLPNRGQEYVLDEIVSGRLWLVVFAVAALLWRRCRGLLPITVFVPLYLAYVVRVGGDWMPFGRFVLPAVPLIMVLLVAGGAELIAGAARLSLVARVVAWSAGATAFVVLGLSLDHRVVNLPAEDDKVALQADQSAHVRRLLRAAKLLALAVPPGGRLVTDYAGVFGYFTDAYVIDMWGLCTPSIALRGDTSGINPIYGKTCPACYADLNPQFFHVESPLVRRRDAFSGREQVLANVWQSNTIGRYVNLREFVAGRVVDETQGDTLYFLERKGPGFSGATRYPKPGITVEYPF